MNRDDEKAVAARLAVEVMSHPVQLNLRGESAWYLLSAIQLACRHPGLGARLKANLERMGRTIQRSYEDTPWVWELADKGWYAEYDVLSMEGSDDEDRT